MFLLLKDSLEKSEEVCFTEEESLERKSRLSLCLSVCACVLRKEKWSEEILQLFLDKQNFNKRSNLALITKC